MVAMVIVMLITNYSDIQDKTGTSDNATDDSGNNDFGTAVVASSHSKTNASSGI